MPLPFLEAFIQDFAPAQRRALERIAKSDDKVLGDDEIAALLAKVQEGTKPLFESPDLRAEILDACEMNTTLAALKADLTALLLQAQELEQVSVKHENIHRAMINKLHQSLLRLDEVILTNKTRRLNPDVTEVKFIDFFDARNEAATKRRAIVEADTGQLVGSHITSDRYLTRGGEFTPKITSMVLSNGVNPDAGKAFLPGDAATPGDNYAWVEVLLADSKINGTHDAISYDGALVELIVELPQSEDINEIKLAPFGQYPLRVVVAQYDDGSQWQDIGLTLPAVLEFDVQAFRFVPVGARRIRLILFQPEYTFKEFVLEHGQVKRTNYLNVMLDRAIEDQISQEPTGPRKLRNSRRQKAKDALDQALLGNDAELPVDRYTNAVKQIIDIDNPSAVRISKYQYVVGLRVLEVNYKRYATLSEYKAVEMQANSSIYDISVQTDENHQYNENGLPVTAVEWELDIGGGSTLDILPEGTSSIVEVLKLDAKSTASTRFTVVTGTSDVVAVYRDGELLTVTTDYTLSSGAGQVVAVTITPKAWNPAAIYYIEYTPDPAQQSIELLSIRNSIKPVKAEVFQRTQTNLNRLDLKAHPFVMHEVAAATSNWTQPDPFDAVWQYSPPMVRTATADPPFIIGFDGEFYGETPVDYEADDGAGGTIIASSGYIPVNAQDETFYDNSPTSEGTFSGGTSHAALDVITLSDGSTVTVDAQAAGVVTQFTVDSSTSLGGLSVGDTLTQVSTTGSGIDFSLTVDTDNLEYFAIRIQDNSLNPQTAAGAISPQVPGVIELDSTQSVGGTLERVKYEQISVTFPGTTFELEGLTRGYDNTKTPTAHPADTPVKWVTKKDYRPIEVTFNGLHCRNLTNYTTGENPAFTDRGGPPQYIQIGTSLFFDRPLEGRIEVYYRRMVDFLQLRARLYSLDVNREYTPMVNNYVFKLKSATL